MGWGGSLLSPLPDRPYHRLKNKLRLGLIEVPGRAPLLIRVWGVEPISVLRVEVEWFCFSLKFLDLLALCSCLAPFSDPGGSPKAPNLAVVFPKFSHDLHACSVGGA